MARKLDDAKRSKILQAAFYTFGERGYKATTVKDVAQTAGIAVGSIYTYFKDKDALFKAATEDSWNRFTDEMEEILSSPKPFKTRFLRLVDLGFDLIKKIHPLLRGMFYEANRRQLLQKNLDQFCEYLDRFFHEGWKTDNFRIPFKRGERKFFIKLIVSGILFRISLVISEELDKELEEMKMGFKAVLLNYA
ncbi:MAG: TetR/AcrR family transcriptional regulator [Spirochaetota bacterium]